jgi:hypothetical protein
MASDARYLAAVRTAVLNAADDILVALHTGFLCYAGVATSDLNLIREMLGCECERMKEAVQGLGGIFCDEAGWRMTVIANRNLAVATLHPTVELAAHDVAIRASRGVIRHVGCAARITECVHADSQQQAKEHSQHDWRSSTVTRTGSPLHSVQ